MNTDTRRTLIERFFAAFRHRDGATMAACYHPDASFRDPVFSLCGEYIGKMWRMLCARGVDLRIEFANVDVGASNGAADWQAWYTFKSTGRAVHNVVHAEFRFADDLIVEHVDAFDFWRWSRQALGPAGWLLGWSSPLRAKVRREAAQALDRFSG
ncbi:MAG: nuclear transport factor 2 family protein [Rudaea sp.]|nr:nuclear transport factor 2 family protein [Rudaea sp.]